MTSVEDSVSTENDIYAISCVTCLIIECGVVTLIFRCCYINICNKMMHARI